MDALLRAFVSSASDLRCEADPSIRSLLDTYCPEVWVRKLVCYISSTTYPDDLRTAAAALLCELFCSTTSPGSSTAVTASLWPRLSSACQSEVKTRLLQAIGSAPTKILLDEIVRGIIILIGISCGVTNSKLNPSIQDCDGKFISGNEFGPYMTFIMPQVLLMAKLDTDSGLPYEYNGDSDREAMACRTRDLEDKILACRVICYLAGELRERFFPWIEQVAITCIPYLKYSRHHKLKQASAEVMIKLLHASQTGMDNELSEGTNEYHTKLSDNIISALVEALDQGPGFEVCFSMLNALNESFKVSSIILDEKRLKAISDVMQSIIVLVTDTGDGLNRVDKDLETVGEEVFFQVGKCIRTLMTNTTYSFLPFFGEISEYLVHMMAVGRTSREKLTSLFIFGDAVHHYGESALKYIDSYVPYLSQAAEAMDLVVSEAAACVLEAIAKLKTTFLHLPDELHGEIFLRLPPQPVYLLHASATCMRWRNIITDAVFLDKFREFHSIPPVLGVFHNDTNLNRFLPMESGPYGFLNDETSEKLRYMCLQCHHGLVLLADIIPSRLILWDPMKHRQQVVLLPKIVLQLETFNAAIICETEGSHHDYSQCRNGSFRIVFVYATGEILEALVFSSMTGQWKVVGTSDSDLGIQMCKSAAITGSTCHFLLSDLQILSVDFDNEAMHTIAGPLEYETRNVLITAYDGEISIIHILQVELQVYVREHPQMAGTVQSWNLHQVIQLDLLLPYQALPEELYPQVLRGQPCWRVWCAQNYEFARFRLVCYDDESRVLFVWAEGVVFAIDLETQHPKELWHDIVLDAGYPYCSFYTPAAKVTLKVPGGKANRDLIRFSLKRKRPHSSAC